MVPKKAKHKLHFDLMENTKENTVYDSLLSNTGVYERTGPSLCSLACFLTEAACSSGPRNGPLPSPQGSTSLAWEVVSTQDIPTPCTSRTTSQQRGLVNQGSRISSRAGSRLQGRLPLLPNQKHPRAAADLTTIRAEGETPFFLSLHHIDTCEPILR